VGAASSRDAPGVAQESDPGGGHEDDDDQRGDRVGAGEAGQDHDEAGDRGGDEREQVVEDVLERAFDVEAGPVRLRHAPRGGHVHHNARDGGGQDQAAGHRRRVEQPPDCFVGQPPAEQQKGETVGLRGEDLGAFQAEGVSAAGRAGREPHRDQGQDDRRGVGEHVRRVGQQRQRSGEQPDHDLAGHEHHDQAQRGSQPAPVGVGADRMAVPAVRLVPVVVVVTHRCAPLL
jgi:hypothetical protein